ncbi:winged helix-turn-helix domain-containing protein [Paenibacillus solisilvae]|uniref:Winged helix-turn-helix domain-containing protein n=1 Tax=Paenibacillus solisilvae TaxID=2486751 RepID=A0ABW0VQ41_9BACL
MDVERMSVFRAEQAIHLTKKEFDILRLFLLNPGHVVTRDQLLDENWGTEPL